MRIGAAGAERTDGSPTGILLCFPVRHLRLNVERGHAEIDLRIKGLTVKGRGQFLMFHLKGDFGYPGDAGRSYQVTDIGLDRSDGAVLATGGIRPKCLGQSSDFHRIP